MPLPDFESTLNSVGLLSLAAFDLDAKSFLVRLIESTPKLIPVEDVSIWLANKTSGGYELLLSEHQKAKRQKIAEGHTLSRDIVLQLNRNIPIVADFPIPWAAHGDLRLACQVHSSGRILGVIDFNFGDHAAGNTESKIKATTELVSHVCSALDHVLQASMIRELNNALSRIAEAETIPELVSSLLEGGFRITDTKIGAVLRLDKETGGLDVALHQPSYAADTALSIDEGITGHCLRHLKVWRLGNVKEHSKFKEYWPGTYSELCVPLYVPKSSARVANKDGPGTHLEDQPKRIGVLNFESPLIDAFSEAEEKHLMQLAKSGSVSFDRLQVQESLRELHSAESELAKRLVAGNDWLDDIKAVGSQIHHALSYSHINISVVTLDGNRIRSEYISWSRTKEDSEKFKQMSDHDIASSKDIQADVVKTKQIEVPENNDPRLHPEIHRLFQLDSLIRVYIPLVMGEIVVGTLEAGYRRKFRQYIFERDIQMLKALGDYATAAIWKKRRGRLDELRHEIAAPRQAIMDNAFFLKRNWHSLLPQKISWKLDDILLDGETIDALLDKMEYFLTGHLKETKTEVCNFGGQVISKTIFQQSRKLRAFNADVGRISYKPDGKIVARVDKVKLAAVFSNLFQNAIKYRESDESFRVDIAVETRTDRYLVQVADHGIGIDAGCETRIFDEGFRTPSAIQKASGSGLGLWLSRAYMRDMKGDLVLTQSKNPTTFQIVIPRETR